MTGRKLKRPNKRDSRLTRAVLYNAVRRAW